MTATKNINRVDFFQASRDLSDRVSEFFRCVLHKKELNLIYNEKISSEEKSLENLLEIDEKGTTIPELQDPIAREKMATVKMARIEELRRQKQEQIDKEATFTWTDSDKEFKKSIKNATCNDEIVKAVRKWFADYTLVIDGTDFERACIESVGKKIKDRKIIDSEGAECMAYDENNALKNMYGVSFEYMVQAGTIKSAQIPEVLREKYAKKGSKKNRTKKADK